MGWPGPMTARQFRAWTAWLDAQWERPSRADHYAMQTSYLVCRANAKHPDRVKQEQFVIKFRRPGEEQPVSVEQATVWARAKWGFAARGGEEQ